MNAFVYFVRKKIIFTAQISIKEIGNTGLRIARQVDVQLDGWRLATLAAVAVRRKLAQCNSSQEKCKLHLLLAAA